MGTPNQNTQVLFSSKASALAVNQTNVKEFNGQTYSCFPNKLFPSKVSNKLICQALVIATTLEICKCSGNSRQGAELRNTVCRRDPNWLFWHCGARLCEKEEKRDTSEPAPVEANYIFEERLAINNIYVQTDGQCHHCLIVLACCCQFSVVLCFLLFGQNCHINLMHGMHVALDIVRICWEPQPFFYHLLARCQQWYTPQLEYIVHDLVFNQLRCKLWCFS